MATAQYSVGIDLGTTHTVVAYAAHGSGKARTAQDASITVFAIPQLVSPGAVHALPLLPSVRYHAAPGELAAADLALPWDAPAVAAYEPAHQTADAPNSEPTNGPATGPVVIGQLARLLGAQVPQRLVSSAKSWLSHTAVDRTAAFLPWGAPPEVPKVSPVQASADTLAHVRAAWNAQFPASPLEAQDVVLTLPASFDESARALTLQAAHAAGLPTLRLLEEPQAAFYDWLHRHRTDLNVALGESRLVLVCDVGGGTTDLSLIQIDMAQGQPQISRIGVGNHLMLGGDNMDLALAHTVESRLVRGAGADSAPCPPPALRAPPCTEQNPPPLPAPDSTNTAPLSASQLAQLIERCRNAKELLLAADAPEQTTVTLLGSGTRLVGASRSCALTRAEVEALVLDGFFPVVAANAPIQAGRRGLVAFGLPYARDAAITRHIAAFLRQHASTMPDTVLLNGGVFRAPALAQRLQNTLAAWRGAPLRLLHNDNPDVAVARGAVAYALAQQGHTPTIGAGTARSYFLLLQGSDGHAKRGRARTATQGICILPRLTLPGHEVRLSEHTFALRVGQPVRFNLCSASADPSGQAPYAIGQTVALTGPDFVRLPPIVTALAADAIKSTNTNDTAFPQKDVPVQLVASLTEVGTLALHCVAVADPAQRWLLEFDLRHAQALDQNDTDGENGGTNPDAAAPPRLHEAIKKLDRIFGTNAQKVDTKEVRQLRAQLEQLLGGREQWPLDLLRPLFDALWQRARGRFRSAEHERVWLNLAGYCLRPGWGDALDDWRVQQLWTLLPGGVQFSRDKQVCAQWWTLWRRVAGGLDASAQLRLLDDFAYNLQSSLADDPDDTDAPKSKPVKAEPQDMLRLGASLERIPAAYKVEVGEWLLGRIQKAVAAAAKAAKPDSADTLVGLWALGRMGARQPLYGSTHEVAPPDAVTPWVETFLTLDWKRMDAAAFAATQIARVSDDRVRDLPQVLRDRVAAQLHTSGAPAAWEAMVRHKVDLDEAQQSRIVGESLPPGLTLIR